MLRFAFSTVACHDWTLSRAVVAAAGAGYDGLELRTFGDRSTLFACDPALTGAEKVRALLSAESLTPAVLATSVRFDEPIRPPVIGRVIGDFERSVRDAKAAIELAAQIEAPLVRVFAFEVPVNESHKSATRRIVERLGLVADAARHTSVRIVVENGGSYPRAAQLAAILDAVASPLVGAAYSHAVGAAAGDAPDDAVRVLRDRLWVAKIKDRDKSGRPCLPGDGVIDARPLLASLAGRDAWVVFEWDRAWIEGLAPANEVLAPALERLAAWSRASAGRGSTGRGSSGQGEVARAR